MRAMHAVAAVLVALFLVAPAQAQAPADADFLRQANELDAAGIAAGQLAMQQAQTPEARRLAQQLVNVHSMNNSKLQQLAAQIGVPLPPASAAVDFGGLGPDFDHAFLAAQVRDHEAAVALYERQGTHGQHWLVRDFARQAQLPLQELYTQALDLAARG